MAKDIVITLSESDARRIWREIRDMKDPDLSLEKLQRQISEKLPKSPPGEAYSF